MTDESWRNKLSDLMLAGGGRAWNRSDLVQAVKNADQIVRDALGGPRTVGMSDTTVIRSIAFMLVLRELLEYDLNDDQGSEDEPVGDD